MSKKNSVTIEADNLNFRELNSRIRDSVQAGCSQITLNSVCGQRYIGLGLGTGLKITVNGIPGNDSAMFMGGTSLIINGNAQDGLGNTMDSGTVVVHGHSGDILGHGMRGGQIYVRDSVGTRVGIHMKSYKQKKPIIVIGGSAGDFFGEYMAGGILIVLGINRGKQDILGRFVGTGMHGGTIYIRGQVSDFQLGKEVKVFDLDDKDHQIIEKYAAKFCAHFSVDKSAIFKQKFIKLQPYTHRPYGRLYAY